MPELAEPAAAVEQFDCPTCEVSAESACRTRGGKVAPKCHTPRFMLVPQLRAELEVKTPADRGPGRAWEMGPAIDAATPEAATRPTRVGYARCSTAQQELQSQLDALQEAGCDPVFSEKISTRIKVRPEFTKAMDFARTIKTAVPHQRVILTVHEMKRLGRGAAELLAIAENLRHHDIELELLTGPLQGVYDPSGHGAALFAFFAGMAESEREYIREKSLEGQASARERGRHGGRPKVVDDDMAAYARALRDQNIPVPEIARKLVIPSGKNKGEHPSVATVYRILAEDTGATETTA
ncbi:recombinase family protein [Streptomyces sp. NPDC058892]|uniref:recombinase family protein n=1 Tax=unclassified Streptomyces TaxID=2593676 RepID=UPI0036790111